MAYRATVVEGNPAREPHVRPFIGWPGAYSMSTLRIFDRCSLFAVLIASCSGAQSQGDRRFQVGEGPGMAAFVDVNSDRYLDLVVANEGAGTATVLLGDGKGGFTPAAGSPIAAGEDPNDFTVGDFNGDGHIDLAFANHDTQHLTLLLGDGRGGFAPAPTSPVSVAVKPHPHGVAAGDFDRDGSLDLITDSWADDRLEILFNNGTASFPSPGRYLAVGRHPYQRIRVADLDGNGTADIVSPNLDGHDVTILLSDGHGGFRQPPGSPFPCGDAPFNVAIGDVNADGFPDLAIVNSPSSTTDQRGQDGLTVLFGDGHGGFKAMAGSPLAMARFPNFVAIGDLDGDGVADIVVSDPDGDHISIFTMTRTGSVGSRRDVPVSGHPKGLSIADVNGDGKGDIAVTNNTANTVTVILGK